MKPIPENYDFEPIELSLIDRVKALKLDLSKDLPPPPVALKVNGMIFGTLGNFSLLTGKAKSKKTFLTTLGMAGALGSKGIFEGRLPPGKDRVIFVDTEQGEYHVLKVGKRVLRLLGAERIPENFDVYSFRKLLYHERHEAIEHLIQTTPDLGLLVIDGIKDLIKSINDEAEATLIADDLLRWTEEYQIHIITVLHQNKGDKNARGHVGTELINKAETVVSVEREPKTEVSKVEVEFSRNMEFPPFGFLVNAEGLPEVVEGWKPKEEDRAKANRVTPEDLDPYLHTKIIREIAQNGDKFTNADLIEQIILAVSKHYETIGQSKAKTFKTYYKNEGYLTHHGKERSPNAYYTLNHEGENDEK
jgi:hypothetical protein